MVKAFLDGVSSLDINSSASYEEALSITKSRQGQKHAEFNRKFIANNPLRKYFVEYKAENIAEVKEIEKIETLIGTVEKYFDPALFNEGNLKQNLMLKRESETNGLREGISLRNYPNQEYTVLHLYCVQDATFDELTQKLEGKQLSTILRFEGVPTKDEVVDYLCVKLQLENQKPGGKILDNQSRYNFWRAKDFRFPNKTKGPEQLGLFGGSVPHE